MLFLVVFPSKIMLTRLLCSSTCSSRKIQSWISKIYNPCLNGIDFKNSVLFIAEWRALRVRLINKYFEIVALSIGTTFSRTFHRHDPRIFPGRCRWTVFALFNVKSNTNYQNSIFHCPFISLLKRLHLDFTVKYNYLSVYCRTFPWQSMTPLTMTSGQFSNFT